MIWYVVLFLNYVVFQRGRKSQTGDFSPRLCVQESGQPHHVADAFSGYGCWIYLVITWLGQHGISVLKRYRQVDTVMKLSLLLMVSFDLDVPVVLFSVQCNYMYSSYLYWPQTVLISGIVLIVTMSLYFPYFCLLGRPGNKTFLLWTGGRVRSSFPGVLPKPLKEWICLYYLLYLLNLSAPSEPPSYTNIQINTKEPCSSQAAIATEICHERLQACHRAVLFLQHVFQHRYFSPGLK